MNELIGLLHQLEASHFYGSVEVKIEAGAVVLIRKSETFKPTSKNRGYNHESGH